MKRFARWLPAMLGLLLVAPATAGTTVAVENLALGFADNGDLLEARACLLACDAGAIHERSLAAAQGLVVFGDASAERFSLERRDTPEAVELGFTSPDGAQQRRWRIPRQGWRLELETTGVNEVLISGSADFQPRDAAGFGAWLEQPRYLDLGEDSFEVIPVDELTDTSRVINGWGGFRDRFWTVVVRSAGRADFQFSPVNDSAMPQGPSMTLGGAGLETLSLYLGPVEPRALRSADPQLHQMMYAGLWFWLRWICDGLFWLLALVQQLIPNWALAIMALSVAVHFLMRPLSMIADRLQDDVHRTEARLAPELKEIKRNYKGEEQSERVLALYKAHGVNPLYSLKSLAGVAVVIPVFIGAFDMLAENIWLAEAGFLWIDDLSRPDHFFALPFTIPFFGGYFNLLPFIMTGLSVAASALHRHEDMDDASFGHHKRNLTLMALAFLALFYTFPAGMVLYWTTNNLLSVVKYGWRAARRAS